MKTFALVIRLAVISLTVSLLARAAETSNVTFKFSTIHVKGEMATRVVGVNDAGVMVGTWVDSGGAIHGLMLKSGKATTIEDPKGVVTYCKGVNLSGDIVGYYQDSSGVFHGFLRRRGKFTDVGPAGAASSVAFGINDKGNIAGFFMDAKNVAHGFVRKGKQYLQLDVPGARLTEAVGINNAGLVTVQTENEHANHIDGAIYDGRTYTMIDVPGAISSYPWGIDSAGDVVFAWTDAEGKFHGALRVVGGTMYKFDDPKGTRGTDAEGINDHAVVVGLFLTSRNGSAEGFKAVYK